MPLKSLGFQQAMSLILSSCCYISFLVFVVFEELRQAVEIQGPVGTDFARWCQAVFPATAEVKESAI